MVFIVVYVLLATYVVWAAVKTFAAADRLDDPFSRKAVQIKVRNGLLIRFLVLTLYFGAALWAGRHVLNRGGVGEIFVFFGVGLVGASAAFVMWIYRFHAACERFLEQLVRVRQQLDQNQNRPQALSN